MEQEKPLDASVYQLRLSETLLKEGSTLRSASTGLLSGFIYIYIYIFLRSRAKRRQSETKRRRRPRLFPLPSLPGVYRREISSCRSLLGGVDECLHLVCFSLVKAVQAGRRPHLHLHYHHHHTSTTRIRMSGM